MRQEWIYLTPNETPRVEPQGLPIAYTKPASKEAVKRVMHGDKSEWVWVRLANGDLILGVFPQDETYERCTQQWGAP